MQLNEKYDREDFLDFLINHFLTDFEKDVRPVNPKGLTIINSASYLGQSKSLDLHIFELSYSESHANKRIALATDGFRIMQSTATFNALIVFNPQNKKNWRLSLMTANPEKNEKGGVSVHLSNPRRFSFELGGNAKINTPYNFLIKKGKISDLDDLGRRFSIEVVNKEFYAQIAELFTELVGGTRGEGRNQRKYPGIIALPSVSKESKENHEFAVRLIGRIIFCWFLREKKSDSDSPLISKEMLSLEAFNNNPDYYHSILEPLFFEVLNKSFKFRAEEYKNSLFGKTPYLNGGLFTPQTWDYYDSKLRFILNIPDEWIRKLFDVLELYNFTVDENTSVDIDLSIDPEMLGRIFENLLAEINPETGETARKSTGSYYTPRTIVDYMVDESLIQYLKDKTAIDEDKLRVLVSYDLNDDKEYPFNEDEKTKIVESLSKITILDPACGSGAFPIGALQKIVYILQRIDQDAKLWFKQQIEGSAPEIKKIIEREFAERNFDYIRKLGIIRQSIFGVDIQPIATEIARLRCFLTLVVDERVNDEEENRGIEPLPNLDFKFVTANSLIGLPSSQANSQVGLFEDQEGINKLKEVRDMYFNASGNEREQLRTQFVQIQNKMFQKMIQEHTLAELTQRLSSWNPFGHEASDWFDPDWMFGIKEGFCIIISNPPYSELRDLEKNMQEVYKKSLFYKYALGGRINLFQFFYPLAISIIKDNGIITLITQNSLLAEDSALRNRKYIVENTKILKLVSFPERDDHKKRVFENVKMSVCIGVLKKTLDKDYTFEIIVWYDRYLEEGHKLLVSLSEIKSIFPDKFIFPVATEKSYKILKKIKQKSDAFYVEAKSGEIDVTQYKDKFNFAKKGYRVLTGAQVLRYRTTDTPSQGKVPYLDIELTNLSSDKLEDINHERIVMQRITGVDSKIRLIMTLAPKNILCANSTNYISHSRLIKYILCILNSFLINYYLKQTSTNTNITTDEINDIPIPNSNNNEVLIMSLVDKIMEITNANDFQKNTEGKSKVINYEKQIDRLVYKLYDLTPEEIVVVEDKKSEN